MDIRNTHWTRTDQSDGAAETLRLVTLSDEADGFYCEALEQETPYLVQVTTGPGPGDDFVGLYDLDGEQYNAPSGAEWEIADEAPEDVVEQIETGWASGLSTVTREVAS